MEVVVEKEVVMVVVAARHLRTRHAERRGIERFDRLRGERLVQGAARVGVCGELRAGGVDERRHRAAQRRERRRRQRRLARRRLVGLVEAREEIGRLRADDAADAAVERREEEEAEQLDDGGHRRERRRVREQRGGGGGLVDDERHEVLEGLRRARLPRRGRVVREEEAGEPVEGGRNGVSGRLCACEAPCPRRVPSHRCWFALPSRGRRRSSSSLPTKLCQCIALILRSSMSRSSSEARTCSGGCGP